MLTLFLDYNVYYMLHNKPNHFIVQKLVYFPLAQEIRAPSYELGGRECKSFEGIKKDFVNY